jgi:hypothetical protein
MGFPLLDQLHDIASISEPIRNTSGHSRRHANAAVDPGEIVPASVTGGHGNATVDLLGMTGGWTAKALHVLAHRLIVLFNIRR